MYIDNLLTPSAIGKRRRMYRLLGPDGKGIIVPLDDNLISSRPEGLRFFQNKLSEIEKGKPNAILCYFGTASTISDFGIPLIMNISASTVQSTHTKKVIVSTVQQAVALDAVAVAVHINVSSRYESEMIANLGAVAEVCNQYGMPLLAIIYPRKEKGEGDDNYIQMKNDRREKYTEIVSHCVRIAFELGADIIKTQYTGDVMSFKEVVRSAVNRPIVIAGGELCGESQLYEMVREAMKAGAAGVSIGRNIFNRDNAAEIIKNLKEIVWEKGTE